MMIKGANIIAMHKSAVMTALIAGLTRLHLTRKVFPSKNAIKIESSTPVARVKVAAPKKKQPAKAAHVFGI